MWREEEIVGGHFSDRKNRHGDDKAREGVLYMRKAGTKYERGRSTRHEREVREIDRLR